VSCVEIKGSNADPVGTPVGSDDTDVELIDACLAVGKFEGLGEVDGKAVGSETGK